MMCLCTETAVIPLVATAFNALALTHVHLGAFLVRI